MPFAVVVGAALVGILVLVGVFKLMWRVAEPNEALIISGLHSSGPQGTAESLGFKIVTGKGVLVLPGIQTVRRLSLSLYETELEVNCVTTQGVPVVVQGVVIFKIGDSFPMIANSARRFLGQQEVMQNQVFSVFEGHLRSIVGSLTVEEMVRERDKLAGQVRSASGVDLEKLGLVVDSLQIKDLQDPTNYIGNLAKPHIAAVQSAARIAEAINDRQASEAEAQAAALTAAARRESDIKQAGFRAEVQEASARSDQAGPLADATARQQVVVQQTEVAKLEAAREEQRLQATVRKPADARAYEQRTAAEAARDAAISAAEAAARQTELAAGAAATAAEATARATRMTGEAEAAATLARGEAAASAIKAQALAEADGIKARGVALGTNQDAVIAQQLAENMPQIIAAAAAPFGHVDQLTVLNGAEGLNGMIAGIIGQVGTLLPMLTNALSKDGKDGATDNRAGSNGQAKPGAIPAGDEPRTSGKR